MSDLSTVQPQHHKLKLRKEFVQPVLEGKKTFEVRLNDRNYRVGDTLKFIPVEAVDGEKQEVKRISMPEIEDMVFEITYILEGWGLQDNYVVFAFKNKEEKYEYFKKTLC